MIRKLFVYLILILATTLFLDHKSLEANEQAHGLWGFGKQLGFVELGTNQGLKNSFLLKSLDYARNLAIQSGCIPTDEIDGFIKRMKRTNNTRSLYSDITAYRQRMANYVRDNCSCSDKSSSGSRTSALTGEWELILDEFTEGKVVLLRQISGGGVVTPIRLTVTQSGTRIQGTGRDGRLGTVSLEGKVDGKQVSIDLTGGGARTLTGILSGNGKSMSGKYAKPGSTGAKNDWSMELVKSTQTTKVAPRTQERTQIPTPPPKQNRESAPQPGSGGQPDLTRLSSMLWSRRLPEALAEYRLLAQRHPNNLSVRIGKTALELVLNKDRKPVTTEAETLLQQYPNNPQTLVLRGQVAFWNNNQTKAQELFRRALAIDPQMAGTHNKQGILFFNQGVPELALQQIVTALAMDSKTYFTGHYYLGLIYEQLNSPQRAIQEFEAFLNIDSESQWAQGARQNIARLRGESGQ